MARDSQAICTVGTVLDSLLWTGRIDAVEFAQQVAQLPLEALKIWRAGVAAVDTGTLLRKAVRIEGDRLLVGHLEFSLDAIERIAVVGAGKAAAPMAEALEWVLGPDVLRAKKVHGWVNVPETTVKRLQAIYLHPARPLGVNEPTEAAVRGTEEIMKLVQSLGPRDLCFCLITGGASALLPLPVPPLTLEEKIAVTRALSAAGANIDQLNTVRKHLSLVKGGRLAAACKALALVTLIISDVLGDRLDVIGSGPTVRDSTSAEDALAVLRELKLAPPEVPETVFRILEAERHRPPTQWTSRVENIIIGNLETAVEAAAEEARKLGYEVRREVAREAEPTAEEVAARLVQEFIRMQSSSRPQCLVSGGEPVVRLVEASRRGRGGRNQQLVLAALDFLLQMRDLDPTRAKFALLSGGTDGEDGPTDAAGAWIDETMLRAVRQAGVEPADFLARNDAYTFFEEWGTLIKTGPTHTNVGDVRVILTCPER